MERLGWWLCAGLAMLGGGSDDEAGGDGAIDVDRPHALLGSVRESRIVYPLAVGEWQAVGEHLFEDEEDGVCVRYVHGPDRDRWIDVYFYPAGALTHAQFSDAVRMEVDLIRRAHLQAGHAGFDMGRARSFSFRGDDSGAIDGEAFDLSYAVDGVHYSSAMTLLLDRLYFVKARYSIEQARASRRETREQLQTFVAQLQPRVSISNACDGSAAWSSQPGADLAADMREIRLEYQAVDAIPARIPAARATELTAG